MNNDALTLDTTLHYTPVVIPQPNDTQYHVTPTSDGNALDTLMVYGNNTPSVFDYHTDSLATVHQVYDGIEIQTTASTDSWVLLLMLLIFTFFSFSYRNSAKYLEVVFSSLFKVKDRSYFADTTINETQLKGSLLLLTFFTEGIALYYALLMQQTTIAGNIFLSMLICIACCTIYYILQKYTYLLLGNIFADNSQTQHFCEHFTSVHLFIGIFFTPAILLLVFIPQIQYISLIICALIYILSRALIIFKGIKIFSLDIFGLLYLILYLCALEITPIFLIKKAIVYLYNFAQLNIL